MSTNVEPWGLSKSLVSTADRPSQSLATRLRFTRTSSHSGKTGRSKLPISRAQVSCRGCLRNLCINHRSLLTRAWPATGKPRIGNEFSPSFSVSLFPGCLHPKLRARRAELTTEDSSEALPQTFGVRCVSTALVCGEAAFFGSTDANRQRLNAAASSQTKAVLTHRTPKV